MSGSAREGPLMGAEEAWAITLLTDRQLRAYRYRREGRSWNEIGRLMDITKQAAMKLAGKADQRLALHTATHESAWDAAAAAAWATMSPVERSRFKRLIETAPSEEEAEHRLRQRLRKLERQRRARSEHDDWSRAAGEDEAEFAAELEADYGINPRTGKPMQRSDFVKDDGKGHGRL